MNKKKKTYPSEQNTPEPQPEAEETGAPVSESPEEKTAGGDADDKEEKSPGNTAGKDAGKPEENAEPEEASDNGAAAGKDKPDKPGDDEKNSSGKEAPVYEENAAIQESRRRAKLKKDKNYRKGKNIYDFGVLLMCVVLMMNFLRYMLGIEIMIGGVFCTSYFYFLAVIPLAMMITGIIISGKAAKAYDVKEKNKLWLTIFSILSVFIIALGVSDIVSPSYRIYKVKDVSIDSTELVGVEYLRLKPFEEAPAELPDYHYVDVYRKYGIFLKKGIGAAVYNGQYKIEKSGDNYTLSIIVLGNEEKFPFVN